MRWLVPLFASLGVVMAITAAEFSDCPSVQNPILAAMTGVWFVLVLPYAQQPRTQVVRVFGGALVVAGAAAVYTWLTSLTTSMALDVLIGLVAASVATLVITRILRPGGA